MSTPKLIKRAVGKAISWVRPPVTREDVAFAAQAHLLGTTGHKVILDVGAYDGEVSKQYNQMLGGNCTIWAFEPFAETYATLTSAVGNFPNIKPQNLALSNTTGTIQFHSNKFAATNSVLPTAQEAATVWNSDILETVTTVEVPSITVDDFLAKEGIEWVDLMKLDTQGSEFMVFEGASTSFRAGKVGIVYTEIITMPSYDGQKHLDEVLLMMRDFGFALYNLYPAANKEGKVRYLDALFVHSNPSKPSSL